MKIKYSTIAMSRNKNSSFRTAERVWKTLFKANVTVLLLVLINNVNISRLNWIGRQLQPVELAAGELAVNWQTTSAWWPELLFHILSHASNHLSDSTLETVRNVSVLQFQRSTVARPVSFFHSFLVDENQTFLGSPRLSAHEWNWGGK